MNDGETPQGRDRQAGRAAKGLGHVSPLYCPHRQIPTELFDSKLRELDPNVT